MKLLDIDEFTVRVFTDQPTVMMHNNHFSFSYTPANVIVKPEFMDKYKYFGGLQCNYDEGTPEYIELENYLSKIAETILHNIG